MAKRKHTPEQVINKLREAEVAIAAGSTVAETVRRMGVTQQTVKGGEKVDQGAGIPRGRRSPGPIPRRGRCQSRSSPGQAQKAGCSPIENPPATVSPGDFTEKPLEPLFRPEVTPEHTQTSPIGSAASGSEDPGHLRPGSNPRCRQRLAPFVTEAPSERLAGRARVGPWSGWVPYIGWLRGILRSSSGNQHQEVYSSPGAMQAGRDMHVNFPGETKETPSKIGEAHFPH